MPTKEVIKRWYGNVPKYFGLPISDYTKAATLEVIDKALTSYIDNTVYFDLNNDGVEEEYIVVDCKVKNITNGICDLSLELQPTKNLDLGE